MIISDINECDEIIGGIVSKGGCQQRCNNTIGTYFCSCNDGYFLTVDGRNCEGMVLQQFCIKMSSFWSWIYQKKLKFTFLQYT